MLKKIHIQNYQSHKDSVLEFSPGVNVIVGASDSGKSAILRALNWAWRNKPAGDAMRSHWGGETRVSVETDTDVIVRTKHTKDSYKLNDTVFTAFGQKVPAEIEKAWNMEEVNVHNQMAGPFLLADSSSPGSVARFFNRLINLEKIDQTIKKINADISRVGSSIADKTEQISKAEEQIQKFAYLPKLEADIEVLEDYETRITKVYSSQRTLQSLCDNIYKVEKDLQDVSLILQARPQVERALELSKQKKDIEVRILALSRIVRTIQTVEEKQTEMGHILQAKQSVDQGLELLERRKIVFQKHKRLVGVVSELERKIIELAEQKRTFSNLHSKFIQDFPETCPLCGHKEKKNEN